jgi:uncharacterized protein YkwD
MPAYQFCRFIIRIFSVLLMKSGTMRKQIVLFLVLSCAFLAGCDMQTGVNLMLEPFLQPMPTSIALLTLASNTSATLTPFQPQPATPTVAPTATGTPTPEDTFTPVPTETGTMTDTPVASSTATQTSTVQPTPTRTPGHVVYSTPTRSSPSGPTATKTRTPTATRTSTKTYTPTASSTTNPLATSTNTPTNTYTYTPSASPTATSTFTSTPTFTPTGSSTDTYTPTSSYTPTNTPTNTFTPTSTATVAGCDPGFSTSFEAQVVALINQQRLLNGLPALLVRAQLTTAARSHSVDMACNDYFSHTGLDGSTPLDRVLREGYYAFSVGENLYGGQLSTPDSVVTWWMNSGPHRANILNINFTSIGVGYASTTTSTYQKYWTAVFSQP